MQSKTDMPLAEMKCPRCGELNIKGTSNCKHCQVGFRYEPEMPKIDHQAIQIQELTGKVSDLEQAIANYKTTGLSPEQVAGLQQNIAKYSQEITTLQNNIKSNAQEFDLLRDTAVEYAQELDALRNAHSNTQKEAEGHKYAAKTYAEKIKTLEGQLTALQGKIGGSAQEIAARQAEAEKYKAELTVVKKDAAMLPAVKSQLTVAEVKATGLEKTVKTYSDLGFSTPESLKAGIERGAKILAELELYRVSGTPEYIKQALEKLASVNEREKQVAAQVNKLKIYAAQLVKRKDELDEREKKLSQTYAQQQGTQSQYGPTRACHACNNTIPTDFISCPYCNTKQVPADSKKAESLEDYLKNLGEADNVPIENTEAHKINTKCPKCGCLCGKCKQQGKTCCCGHLKEKESLDKYLRLLEDDGFICPSCAKPIDNQPMARCANCKIALHLSCANRAVECPKCKNIL